MLKTAIYALALGVVATPAWAEPAPAPAATAVALSTADTTIGDLLADPAAKAVIDKHIPGLSDNPQISMAAGMTLRALQPLAGDKISTEALDAIDAELKAPKTAKK